MDRLPTNSALIDNIQYATSKLYPLCCSQLTTNAHNLPYTCYEVGHTWNPSCVKTAIDLFITCFKESVKIYGMFYTITALLRGRSLKYFLSKLPIEIVRSATFLSANHFYFIAFFCLHRKLLGRFSYSGVFLFSLPACYLSLIIERKQRYGMLALYLANLATETAFNAMVERKWIPSINNGQVLLFSMVSAVYVYLFRTQALNGSIFNGFKLFLGTDELNTKHDNNIQRKSRIVKYYGFITEILNDLTNFILKKSKNSNSRIYGMMKSIEYKMELFLDHLSIAKGSKHHLCSHRYSCLLHSVIGFIQRFSAGFLLQAGIKLASSLLAIIKKPKLIGKILTSPVNVELGLFFGSYNLIFRACNCLLRWITNKNNKYHSVISGFFAGWSMVFYKSTSISLYMMFKLFEILWMLGVKSNILPVVKHFDAALYTVSTAFILWMACFEPHNIRKQYWSFLLRTSGKRFIEFNRALLQGFGTNATKIKPNWRPLYNAALSDINSHLRN